MMLCNKKESGLDGGVSLLKANRFQQSRRPQGRFVDKVASTKPKLRNFCI